MTQSKRRHGRCRPLALQRMKYYKNDGHDKRYPQRETTKPVSEMGKGDGLLTHRLLGRSLLISVTLRRIHYANSEPEFSCTPLLHACVGDGERCPGAASGAPLGLWRVARAQPLG